MIRFEDLLEKVRAYSPDADVELLRKAYVFSAFEHRGQVRHSGEPYLIHPLAVADFLADMKLDAVAIAAGLLHDVVEDTLTTIERIQELFGPDVAHVVEGVTKISAITFSSSEERQAENFRKMLLAMVDDIRVILVKLADRLHNMRTLGHLPDDKRLKIAQETRDIYAPIANRLGMSKLKNELEELSFRYLEPQAYEALRAKVDAKRRATEGFIEELKQTITAKLAEAQVPVIEIDGRIKRLWSISQKLKRQKIELEQVYDFVALRIITEGVKDCYATLGIIHQTWSPVPGRIKDFIAMPRPNGYQSLHTSVISERGMPFEVQIRTIEMHRRAEEGIAAHWKYKEGRSGEQRDDRYFLWMRQLLDIQEEVRDPQEFIQNLKVELYPGRGLPLHAQGAGQGAAARRDAGRLRLFHPHRRRPPMRRREGQRQDGAAPHAAEKRRHRRDRDADGAQAEPRLAEFRRDVARAQQDQTPDPCGGKSARHRTRPEAVREGSPPLRREPEDDPRGRRLHGDSCGVRTHEGRRPVLGDRLRQGSAEAGARSSPSPPTSCARSRPKARSPRRSSACCGTGEEKIKVKGFDDLMVFRARCCNPIRGEKIVGYITRGRGVSVHSATCSNVVNLLYDPERRIDVEWDKGNEGSRYTVKLTMEVEDRQGLLAAVSAKIADINTNIKNMEARTDEGENARIDVTIEISDLKHLEKVIKSLRGVDGVLGVERAGRAG